LGLCISQRQRADVGTFTQHEKAHKKRQQRPGMLISHPVEFVHHKTGSCLRVEPGGIPAAAVFDLSTILHSHRASNQEDDKAATKSASTSASMSTSTRSKKKEHGVIAAAAATTTTEKTATTTTTAPAQQLGAQTMMMMDLAPPIRVQLDSNGELMPAQLEQFRFKTKATIQLPHNSANLDKVSQVRQVRMGVCHGRW
jgi:hypothetical protein